MRHIYSVIFYILHHLFFLYRKSFSCSCGYDIRDTKNANITRINNGKSNYSVMIRSLLLFLSVTLTFLYIIVKQSVILPYISHLLHHRHRKYSFTNSQRYLLHKLWVHILVFYHNYSNLLTILEMIYDFTQKLHH